MRLFFLHRIQNSVICSESVSLVNSGNVKQHYKTKHNHQMDMDLIYSRKLIISG